MKRKRRKFDRRYQTIDDIRRREKVRNKIIVSSLYVISLLTFVFTLYYMSK